MSSSPTLPNPSPELLTLHSHLPAILRTTGHTQVWGITLDPVSPPVFSTLLVLQKYLNSNANDVAVAREKLTETLLWRKEFGIDEPGKLEEWGADDRFRGLGFVTQVRNLEGKVQIVTWNIYGAVDPEKTFDGIDRFLRWRVALMESGILRLNLSETINHLPAPPGLDPHQLMQVHDYRSISFLRLSPATKAATRETIRVLSAHYPEMLDRKFFVNVPWVMSWVFSAAKLIVRRETAAKFCVLSDGKALVGELGMPEDLPKEYGGTGKALGDVKESKLEHAESKGERKELVVAEEVPAASGVTETEVPEAVA